MGEKKPAHVEQALAELAGTDNVEQAKAARKRLTAAGHAPDVPEVTASEDCDPPKRQAPRGRQSKQEARGATA